jgi:hypothetical protein
MSHYVRVLTPQARPVSADRVREGLSAMGRDDLTLVVDETEDDTDWTAIVAYTRDGEAVGLLTRDSIDDQDSLAKEELEDFDEELREALPKSGAHWMRAYLKGVKTIYAVQLMAAAYTPAGEGGPGAMLEAIRAAVGGVIQADGEGFSNEEGAQIVWQYGEDASGPWRAAVLGPDKSWLTFDMDLGNKDHRAAFQDGRVPAGVDLIDPDG